MKTQTKKPLTEKQQLIAKLLKSYNSHTKKVAEIQNEMRAKVAVHVTKMRTILLQVNALKK